MESVTLKLKYMDALKIIIMSAGLPIGLGLGFAAYQGNIDADNIGLFCTLVLGLILTASLIVCLIPYLSLTQDGLNFKNGRGIDIFCDWNENLSIKSEKYGTIPVYTFKQEGNKNSYKIPKILFSYSTTQKFIQNYPPTNHPLRKLIHVN